MALNIIKSNFSSGELDPILSTRGDVAQYHNGAKELTNVIALVEGGVKKRAGTRYIRKGTTSDYVRMLPFAPSASQPFFIILGVGKATIVNATTLDVVTTVTTPYNTVQRVKDVQYINSRYTLFFTHPDFPVQQLRTSADYAAWSWTELIFDIPPLAESGRSPNSTLQPSAKEVGAAIRLTSSPYSNWSATQQYYIGDRVYYNSSYWEAVSDNLNSPPSGSNPNWVYVPESLPNIFSPSDVGSIVKINGGMVRINEFVNSTSVLGVILVELNSTVQALGRSWTITGGAYNATDGYPRCCTFFKQRLVLGGTRKYPNMVWFSRIGDPQNFLETTKDADAFSVAPASDRSDNILHLVQSRGVVALTGGSEFLIDSNEALTPTTVQITEHTAYGAYPDARPTRVANELLFVQRGGERLRALSYRYEVDGLVSPDISILSAHITRNNGGIAELSYQQEPNSLVWVVLENGKVAGVTLNREQEVIAWALEDFNAEVLSIVSTPTLLGSDKTFALIKRLDGQVWLEQLTQDALTDCELGYTVSNNTITTTHLNGFAASGIENVQAWMMVNGAYTQVKIKSRSGDVLTLQDDDYAGKTAYVGAPVKCKISLLPPEFAQYPSSMRTSKITIHSVYATIYNTLGLRVNGEDVDDVRFDDNPLNPLKPFSRVVNIGQYGWTTVEDLEMVIEHDRPLPFHLQAVNLELTVNNK